MKGGDLDREMAAVLAALSPGDVREIAGAGIDPWLAMIGLVAIGRITVERGLFRPDPDGRRAFLTPVRVELGWTPESRDPAGFCRFGEIVDIVAWRPGAPGRALRCGNAAVLGLVAPQFLDPFPVRIWRSPLGWLRAGCEGLALLTDDPIEARAGLCWCAGLIAEDRQHAIELRRLLSRPASQPPVTWSERADAAA